MFGNSDIIQLMQLQNAQKTYQMEDIDLDFLIKFFSKFALVKWKNLKLNNSIFEGGQNWLHYQIKHHLSILTLIFDVYI